MSSFVRFHDGSLSTGPDREGVQRLVRRQIEEAVAAGSGLIVVDSSPDMTAWLFQLQEEFPSEGSPGVPHPKLSYGKPKP